MSSTAASSSVEPSTSASSDDKFALAVAPPAKQESSGSEEGAEERQVRRRRGLNKRGRLSKRAISERYPHLAKDLGALGLDVGILRSVVEAYRHDKHGNDPSAHSLRQIETYAKERATGGQNLVWRNLDFTVSLQGHFWEQSSAESKTLLSSVSGFCNPGELHAIMGPSGSGKTTLISQLARAHRPRPGVKGDIRINGMVAKSGFKHACYLVPQEDALQGSLTVRQNLMYTAMFRLPKMPNAKKVMIVERLIVALGLSRCADTVIGSPFIRGVSGGQRRRVSIAQGLILEPDILLLDEPTSGLDSASAARLIDLLKALARSHNVAVIASIHQPPTQVFHKFDQLTLLTHGQVAYSGPLSQAADHFSKLGFPLPLHMNPADHFVELINDDFEDADSDAAAGTSNDDIEADAVTVEKQIKRLIAGYQKSSIKARLDKVCADAVTKKSKAELEQLKSAQDLDSFNRSFLYQTVVLVRRSVLLYIKNPTIFWVRFAMYSMLALMMGTLYWDASKDQQSIQDIISVLFFSVAFLAFMSIAAFPAFIEDRIIFVRERANGFYRSGAYALAHTLVQLPFVFMIALSFTLISYWMIGLNTADGRAGYFLAMLFAALYTAETIVVVISALIPFYIIGIAAGAGFYGYCMLVGGYFLKKVNMPDGWKWAPWTSFQRYSFEGLMVNEFDGREIPCDDINMPDGSIRKACYWPDLNGDGVLSGSEILDAFDYQDVNKWEWLWVTIAFTVGLRILFYLFIRFFNKAD